MYVLFGNRQVQWLEEKQSVTSENLQNLATEITLHLLHNLQQHIKGCITGVNKNCWTQHLLVDERLSKAILV